MKNCKRISRGVAAVGLAASLILTGCGGGGDGGSIGGSASSTSVGSISGFGSVIVNGVRFDDSAAESAGRVTDDDGKSIASSSLGLGMTVEVSGSVNDDGTGSASSINVFSELQGPISNLEANTFSILGFNITVSSATVFEDFAGLSALANGNIVEVHGTRSGNAITATRIELKTTPVGDEPLIKIRGQVAALNKTTNTFMIGNVTVNYGAAKVSPNVEALDNGDFVKVRSTSVATGNTVTASRVQVVGSRPFGFADGGKSELEGVVSDFVSLSQFKVGGITVNASTATIVRGVKENIADGTRLEIKGVFNNNVITASKVKVEDGARVDEFELHGVVRPFTSLSDFVVRGVTVDASGSGVPGGVLFERGLASEVADGRVIEVEGSIVSTASGSILRATKVKFEDSTGSNTAAGAGEFEFKGTVGSVSGNTLVIGTHTVTLTSNTKFRRMDKAEIVAGAFLEIKGKLQSDGSVIAERISLED